MKNIEIINLKLLSKKFIELGYIMFDSNNVIMIHIFINNFHFEMFDFFK